MADIRYFFSYAREDSDFVLTLAQDLREAGANLWLDQLDIVGGERWDRAIEQALNSCNGMIAVLSPESIASQNVMDEVSYALEEGKLVVPVLLRSCSIPFRLRRVQYVDFTRGYAGGVDQLLRAIHIAPAGRGVRVDRRQESAASRVPPTGADGESTASVDRRPGASTTFTSDPPEHAEHSTREHIPQPVPTSAVVRGDDSVEGRPTARRWTRLTLILLWLSGIAYAGFTFLLLSSSGSDLASGYLFLGNAAVIGAGCIAATAGWLKLEVATFAPAVVQLGILAIMLINRLGEASIVIPIDVGIAAWFAGLGALNRVTGAKTWSRRQTSS